jgi:hypothetical protein
MQCSPFTSGSAFQPLVDLFRTGLASGAAKSEKEASGLVSSRWPTAAVQPRW